MFSANNLNHSFLPTNRNVIEYMLFLRKDDNIKIKLNNYLHEVIKTLSEQWESLKIPIVCKTTIRRRLVVLIDDYSNLVKHTDAVSKVNWSGLFNIAGCRCDIASLKNCPCPASKKIPSFVIDFYIDQCGQRKLTCENVFISDEMDDISQTIPLSTINHSEYVPLFSDHEDIPEDSCEEEDIHLKVSEINLNNFSMALDRSDTSNRYGALLATTLLQDLKVSIAEKLQRKYSEVDNQLLMYLKNLIIDKNKIQRERSKCREMSLKRNKCNTLLTGLSYDGKRNDTLKKEVLENKVRLYKKIEEHITILKEPDSKFIGFVTPTNGSSKEVRKAMTDFLCKEGYSLENLVSISCDGAIVNTGYKSGVNASLEQFIQRPLQWNICLLHFNELPLKHLLIQTFGKTRGPRVWSDTFGADICNAEKFPVGISKKMYKLIILKFINIFFLDLSWV